MHAIHCISQEFRRTSRRTSRRIAHGCAGMLLRGAPVRHGHGHAPKSGFICCSVGHGLQRSTRRRGGLCRRRLILRHNPWQPRLAVDVQWRDAPCDSTVLISRVGRERWRIRDENLPHTRRDCDDLYSEQSIVDSSSKSTKVITCTFSRVRKWRSTSSKMMPVVKA